MPVNLVLPGFFKDFTNKSIGLIISWMNMTESKTFLWLPETREAATLHDAVDDLLPAKAILWIQRFYFMGLLQKYEKCKTVCIIKTKAWKPQSRKNKIQMQLSIINCFIYHKYYLFNWGSINKIRHIKTLISCSFSSKIVITNDEFRNSN